MENIKTVAEHLARLEALKGEMNGVKHPSEDKSAVQKAAVYNSAFWGHLHTGIPENALKEGSDGSGGYLLPDSFDKRLEEALREKNVLRNLGTIITTNQKMHIPVAPKTGSARWVPENTFFPLDDMTFCETVLDAYKIGTLMLLTDEVLEDAGFALEKYICDTISERIGPCEEAAFIDGDGVGKPLGILRQAPVGVVTKAVGTVSLDDVIDLQHSLGSRYRDNAVWVMSEDAYVKLRKIRLFDGRPLWKSKLSEGEPEVLFGHRLYVCKSLPDVTSGSKPILFGDFRFFWIGDRGKRTVKRLSERYADKGCVGFLASQRVDAKLVLPEAVKALEVRAE